MDLNLILSLIFFSKFAKKQLKQVEEGKIIEGKDYVEGIVQKIKELEIKNQDNQVEMNIIKRQKKNNEPFDASFF